MFFLFLMRSFLYILIFLLLFLLLDCLVLSELTLFCCPSSLFLRVMKYAYRTDLFLYLGVCYIQLIYSRLLFLLLSLILCLNLCYANQSS